MSTGPFPPSYTEPLTTILEPGSNQPARNISRTNMPPPLPMDPASIGVPTSDAVDGSRGQCARRPGDGRTHTTPSRPSRPEQRTNCSVRGTVTPTTATTAALHLTQLPLSSHHQTPIHHRLHHHQPPSTKPSLIHTLSSDHVPRRMQPHHHHRVPLP